MKDNSNKSILLIDDQRFFIAAIEPLLTEMGFNVTSSIDPTEATQHLTEKDYSLVLCDLYMPELRGDKLLQHFEIIKPEQKCCLMAAADLDEPLFRRTLMMKNVHAFIKKPICIDELSKLLIEFS